VVALLPLVLPTLVLCALGTAIALRAWPFFTQARVGRGGCEFRCFKLRTLPPQTPRYAAKHEVTHLPVPPFSAALRRLHLDELPQLLLVLSGSMSLVGPRPEMPYLHEAMRPGFQRLRTAVTPGCTGLWQISGYRDQMIDEHPEYDEHYIAHRSLRLDLWIVWRTVRLILPGRAARVASLDELPAWAKPSSSR
jgi:lipopolysaccharide/colanic/teichoic acid biosynthesis glycosyltransferase